LLERGGLTKEVLGSLATGAFNWRNVDAPFVPGEDSENHHRQHKTGNERDNQSDCRAEHVPLLFPLFLQGRENLWQKNASVEVMAITIRTIHATAPLPPKGNSPAPLLASQPARA
jgi:hypothetical protein